MAIEDATGSPGAYTPNSSLHFIPAASNWSIVESAAASGGSYMSAPNDGAPVVLTEETGTAANGLRYGNEATWIQGSVAKTNPGVWTKTEDSGPSVIYRYTDTSNVAYQCTHAGISSGSNTCNGGFGVMSATTYAKQNLPNDHNTSIEVPFTGTNVTATFSIGPSRGKVDIEVRRVSDDTLVRSTTGFDTSTTSNAAFWGMPHGNYKMIIKGTGLQGAATPQGYAHYFHYALVYPSVEYEFFGPSISYEGVTGPDYGKANIYIDGVPQDGDAAQAGVQPFDFYNDVNVWRTLFSTSSLRYSNGGNKHRILIEASAEKNPLSTGYRLTFNQLKALPSISGTIDVPASGSLNIATPANTDMGIWNLLVDGKTEFSVDKNTVPNDKELNMFFTSFTLRNFRVKGLSPGNREFSFVSKNGRDPRSSANKVMFDGITNAAAEHTFTGTTISYIARKGSDQGRVKVFIDDVEQDANSSTSAVDPFELYAPTEQLKQVIFTTSSLTNAQHTIRIEPDGTKHASSTGTGINLDAFQTTMTIDKTFDVATNGAYHMLPFTMGSTQYIAITNQVDYTASTGLDYSLPDTKVYRFDPSTGIMQPPIAVLDTSGAEGVEHFTIGADHYLAVANNGGGVGPFNINNYVRRFHIYKWDPSQNNGIGGFDSDASVAGVTPLQEVGKLGPTDIEFFEEGGEKYLAIGALYKNKLNPSTIEILRWNNSTSGSFGTTAQEVQQFGADGVYRITHFRIAGELYLAVANGFKETSSGFPTSTKSRIYKWGATVNGGSPGFALHQEIATVAAHDMEFFTIDGINYLAIASHDDTPKSTKIYRWDPSTAQFDTTNHVQEFPGQSAVDIEYFQYGAGHYLVQSQAATYPARTTDIYKWNGTKFEIELAQLPGITQGQRVEHFFLGNSLYLTVANNNIPAYTNGFLTPDYSVNSKVYQFE